MKVVEVANAAQAREFVLFPVRMYRQDPNYIRPLDADIEKVFDRKKNKFFQHGECTRWILQDDQGKTIGRVAAFINENNAHTFDQPTGGMGFFECENNLEAAFLLFDTCKAWLQARGMEAMDGPINFGERNMWWGLLIDGYEEPCYGMNYNPIYYRDMFENYGFQIYFRQLSFGMHIDDARPGVYKEKAELLMQDPDYQFRHLEKDKLDKYVEDFRTIYNKAFTSREGVKPISEAAAKAIISSLKPVMVDYLIWFGYHKGEPIALFFMLPELNQYFKHVNGKMNWLGILKFLYLKWTCQVTKVYGTLFGVVPEYQGKGVEGGIIMAANAIVQPKKRWGDLELIWIGDFNQKMVHVAENLGASVVKTHATYRKLFDETRPFKRKAMEG